MIENTPFPKIWTPFTDPKTGRYEGRRKVPFANTTVEVEVWVANFVSTHKYWDNFSK